MAPVAVGILMALSFADPFPAVHAPAGPHQLQNDLCARSTPRARVSAVIWVTDRWVLPSPWNAEPGNI